MTAPTESLWLQPEQPGNIIRQRWDGHWDVADADYLNGLERALEGERQTARDLVDWVNDMAEFARTLPRGEVYDGLVAHMKRGVEIVQVRQLKEPVKVIQL